MDILVSGYSKQPGILRTFATISNKDYTTVIHSVNVMALTLSFCFYSGLSLPETKRLGLSALLHDVGKAEIPSEILSGPAQAHPRGVRGHEIAPGHRGPAHPRDQPARGRRRAWGALEHHEKLDGSGYPKGLQKISFNGRADRHRRLLRGPDQRGPTLPPRHGPPGDVEASQARTSKPASSTASLFEKFCYSLI
ncbi:MAG: HD domain-containing protein [Desulfosudis oleivorans]|nr:HD domain-containing protein [Desulfosudis oleivorans]